MLNNIILQTDSYKVSHYKQYPKGTKYVYSYLEARAKEGQDKEVLFFGLQYILEKYFCGVVLDKEKIDEAEYILNKHLGEGVFNRDGWELMLKRHKGHLPIEIKAVKEGTVNKRGDVLITVCNTDPDFYWLTNYIETVLLQVWFPITVASQSYEIKNIIQRYIDETSDSHIPDFTLHDFGYRGVSSCESAAIGGAAHLVNFSGTDTLAAIELLRDYYESDMPAFSIPASEHSTITSWGEEKEREAMENMLDKYPTGLVACVSDSFDIYKACSDIWGDYLKDKVLERDGTLVVRPDSGNPVDVISKIIEILGNKFGYEVNKKGYKVLNPKIRIIQGDGVNRDSIEEILQKLKDMCWSCENIAFGMGGALLQKMNRDTLSFAFKCSAINVNDEWREVYKNPITDPGKVSKRGLLHLDNDKLITVYNNGHLIVKYSLDEVKENK